LLDLFFHRKISERIWKNKPIGLFFAKKSAQLRYPDKFNYQIIDNQRLIFAVLI